MNDVGKESRITISHESRLEKSQDGNWKNKRIINPYLYEQHQGIKRTNQYRSEISPRKNRGFPKEHEQKLKTWMGNQTGNTNKKASTKSKNGKTKKNARIYWDEKGKATFMVLKVGVLWIFP